MSRWLAAGLGSFEVARCMGMSVRVVDLTPAISHPDPSSTHDARRRLDEWSKNALEPRFAERVTSWKPLNHAPVRGWAILGSNQ